jgi:hypothetical protein
MRKIILIVFGLSFVLLGHADCYIVYDSAGKMIYQSSGAPVDMESQFSVTVPKRFGRGSSMVYETGGKSCETIDVSVQKEAKSSESSYFSSGPGVNFGVMSNSSGGSGSSEGGALQTGPRGGRFHITSSGRKSYESKR